MPMAHKVYVMVVTAADEVLLKTVEGDTSVLPHVELKGDADADALRLTKELYGVDGKVAKRIEHRQELREDWIAVVVRVREPQRIPDGYGMYEYTEALGLTLPYPTLFIVNDFYGNL